jgi:hypothetical protein
VVAAPLGHDILALQIIGKKRGYVPLIQAVKPSLQGTASGNSIANARSDLKSKEGD